MIDDDELYELVRKNYVECNKEYIEEQLRICTEEIKRLEELEQHKREVN